MYAWETSLTEEPGRLFIVHGLARDRHDLLTKPPPPPATSLFLCLLKSHVTSAAAKSLQSCLTLFNPIDGSPPGSAVPGILHARTLEWVAISFSSAWMEKVKVKSLSHVRLLATPWTTAYQAPPSMRFSRQEYWSGMPLPSPHVTSRFNLFCDFHSFQLLPFQTISNFWMLKE